GSRGGSRTQPAESTCPHIPNASSYDVIVFGDEVPGVMSALKVKRELRSRRHSSRVALVTEANTQNGIGGHLVRGGLAYLDRNQVPTHLRSLYGIFGQPSRLYREFLRLGQVDTIALDRFTLSQRFQQALAAANIDIIDNADLGTVQISETLVCAFDASGETYQASYYIDASQSGELATASGVEMMQGLEALGLPDSALSLGLILDFYDVTIDQFKAVEATLINRYFDPRDSAAQEWLTVASGGDTVRRQYLLQSLIDYQRQPKLLYQGTSDSADVRSLALSIMVHGWLGQPYDIQSSGFLFDRANIAIFEDRLSFNALLFYANSEEARQLSISGAQPTPEMMAIANEVKDLFERVGVPRVEIMDELYVRNAGQLANPVDELSATLMAAGGISGSDALGTFGYHLDDRGGIEGLEEQVDESVLRLFNFEQMPVFNYGFRHTLPIEKENLAVLGPASGFGGLGTTAGRIVEFNVSVGEGLAIAIAKSAAENRSLQSITNQEVRQSLGYRPAVYGYRTDSFRAISSLERRFRGTNYEQVYLAQAQSFLSQGNFAEASRTLSRALTLNPRNAEAYALRGTIRLNSQDFERAHADYTEAVRIAPELFEAYLYRGYLNTFEQDYSAAMSDFNRVLRLQSDSAEAEFGKAFARAFQQNILSGGSGVSEMLPWLNDTIRRQPDFAAAYVVRSIAQAQLGNIEQSQIDLEQAIALQRAQGTPSPASSSLSLSF
ncbi:MAG: FAD-dependent oxidoreductase, partial [Cyanobacteria bacterium J06607_10]